MWKIYSLPPARINTTIFSSRYIRAGEVPPVVYREAQTGSGCV
jgi:hypothetical protein